MAETENFKAKSFTIKELKEIIVSDKKDIEQAKYVLHRLGNLTDKQRADMLNFIKLKMETFMVEAPAMIKDR